MKFFLHLLICITIIGCKEAVKEKPSEVVTPVKDTVVDVVEGPEATIKKVFKAHGGLEVWKSMHTISFEIAKKNAREVHTIDLRSRNEKITMDAVQMGFDGNEYWLLDKNNSYKGNPVFYHNLMFYFYAMPFVLADNGIKYAEADSLIYKDKEYPGIQISYNDGVGVSSKDEYFMYYNPETFQMEWLGYTVTFSSGEKSTNVKWIRYNDWREIEGLMLPNSISWFEHEGRELIAPKNTVNYENVVLSNVSKPNSFYKKPAGAKAIESGE